MSQKQISDAQYIREMAQPFRQSEVAELWAHYQRLMAIAARLDRPKAREEETG